MSYIFTNLNTHTHTAQQRHSYCQSSERNEAPRVSAAKLAAETRGALLRIYRDGCRPGAAAGSGAAMEEIVWGWFGWRRAEARGGEGGGVEVATVATEMADVVEMAAAAVAAAASEMAVMGDV